MFSLERKSGSAMRRGKKDIAVFVAVLIVKMKHRFVVDVVVHIFDNQAGMLFKQPQGFRSDFRGANAGNFIRITGFDGYVVREHVSQMTFAAAGRAIQADGEKRPVGPVFDIGKGFGVAGGDHEVLLAEKRLVFESQRQLSDVGVFVHLLSVSFCSKRQKPFWSGRRG